MVKGPVEKVGIQSEGTHGIFTYQLAESFHGCEIHPAAGAAKFTDAAVAVTPDLTHTDFESKGKMVLIVILLVTLVAMLTISGYLMLRYYLPNVLEFGEETTLASETETTAETTEPRIPCESLTLTNSTVELEKVGQAWLLNVVVLPSDTTDDLTYSSSDVSVATVTEHGRVNAVGPGEAIITVSCGDKKLECLIRCTFVEETTGDINGADEP